MSVFGGNFGNSSLAALTQALQSGSNDSKNKNYLWKSNSYQLTNSDTDVAIKATNDGILISLPPIATASDGQSHFIANFDSSTKSIIINTDSAIEDNDNQISLEPGTGYEFVLDKSISTWVLFSR